jgi:hypothetical protein
VVFGVWLALGFVSIAVSGGAIDPRFDATDDRRSVGLVGSLSSIGASLAFAVLSIGALALLVVGGQAVAGTVNLGPISLIPVVGVAMMVGGVVLFAGCGVLVGAILWFANSRLSLFEAGNLTSPT